MLKPTQKTLFEILNDAEVRYYIPDYQRDYSWSVEQFEDLWKDIYDSSVSRSQYFMGAIVLNQDCSVTDGPDSADDHYDVVDGQQRLATFCVLFSVLRNIATKYISDPEDILFLSLPDNDSEENKDYAKRLEGAEARLYDPGVPEQHYLRLNKKDGALFREKIVKDKSWPEDDIKPNDPRLIKAKKVFAREIEKEFIDTNPNGCFKSLYEFFRHLQKKLVFLVIEVGTDSDAYALFEGLNYRGLDLSSADLIKNRLLLECSDENIKRQVLDDWEYISNAIDGPNGSRFSLTEYIRYFWIAFYREQTTQKELYKYVKESLQSRKISPESFVSELKESADYFTEITKKEFVFPSTDYDFDSATRYYAEVNTLGYNICYPIFLLAKSKGIDWEKELVKSILSYLFRLITIARIRVGKAEEKMRDARRILKDDPTNMSDVLSCFNDEDISDGDFKEKFITRQFPNKISKYILTRIHLHRYGSNLIPSHKAVHLEHILPIKWQEHWGNFDAGGVEIENWVENIGNHTLLDKSDNRSATNKSFADKMDYYQKKERGFGEGEATEGTVFPMTYKIHEEYQADCKDWTTDRIRERANELSNNIEAIWPIANCD